MTSPVAGQIGPSKEDRAPKGPIGSRGHLTTPTATQHICFDDLAARARRFDASRRIVPIGPCGCIRDPAVDRHRCDGEISDHMAESAVAAVVHLDGLGTPGLLDRDTLPGHVSHRLPAAGTRCSSPIGGCGMTDDLVARGKAIVESGKYAPPRGEYLGRIDHSGLDVYAGSPQPWIDALFAAEESACR